MRLPSKNSIVDGFLVMLILCCTGCGKHDPVPSTPAKPAPTVSSPNTSFLSKYCQMLGGAPTASSIWVQPFSTTAEADYVYRFSSRYPADFIVIPASQYYNFANNLSTFGYAGFNNNFGTGNVSLKPGQYYLAVRNQITGLNTFSVELDYGMSLPASDRATFDGFSISSSQTVGPGNTVDFLLTIEKGYRYFVNGNNTGLNAYVFKATEIAKFRGKQNFDFLTNYSSTSGDCGKPGFYELSLDPGDYYIGFLNDHSFENSFTLALERWKVE